MESEILLDEIKVMYVKSEDGPQGAAAAFSTLEGKLSTLKGRRFYGIISDEGKTYLAAVAVVAGEDPRALGFGETSIPEGKYVKTKIWDWGGKIDQLYPTFKSLASKYPEDISRPRIEFYRSQKELIIMVPIL
ncbi:MAG: hypothetical protein M1352_02635 [Patescibacteria group bacterium]|nr:hypothetical protein [Patescibacteria group bacterium]